MRDKLYVRRIEGTDAHEVVALVTAEAVEAARAAREDAPARLARREAERKAAREHRERAQRIFRMAEAWIADNLRAAEAKLARMDAMLERVGEGIGKGGKAGW